nr:hypothetical protein HUO10_004515 [Paraburkholderia busanensis]
MDNLGWKISARLARVWFASPAHTYNDDPKSTQPFDDAIVTLDWVLKFRGVRNKYENLLAKDIYKNSALDLAKKKIYDHINKMFSENRKAELGFSTGSFLADIRQFHLDWQFQLTSLSNWDTLENLAPTDLTGALANFNLYAALGKVEVSSERYFRYEKSKNHYCSNVTAKITHIYVYAKDNYSFNGQQYLGHWNKYGVIIAPGSLFSQSGSPKRDTDIDIWIKNINRPVDTRKNLLGKFKETDVYFPVYNADYCRWRDKHQRGGDFMIYSKPAYLKLKKLIDLELGEICRLESSDLPV